MPGAAFFDLDKTLIATSSSFAFAKPFYRAGLIGRPEVVRSIYAHLRFITSGVDHNQMENLRAYMSELVTGWRQEDVNRIVKESLQEIIDPVAYREARDLIREHKSAGRDVIVVSTSGIEIVEPIARYLGADEAIGTTVKVVDGRFTGEILFYAYGAGKAEAIRSLAHERGLDLEQCFAYTDSHTDLPMLQTVGKPVAVNPDRPLRAIAQQNDWPILEFTRPEPHRARPVPPVAAASAALGAVTVLVAWYAWRRAARSPA